MAKIGIFFGTDSGNTRRIAKEIATILGPEVAANPINIRNATVEDLLNYNTLILGIPTYGDGQVPGLSTGNQTESWEEFLPTLKGHDFNGKKVAIYGLGNQKGYPDEFIDAVYYLYEEFDICGATLIGGWPTDGYTFKKSKAIIDNQFMGLALDQDNQRELTSDRVNTWLTSLSLT
jgi:flavodoxin I